MGDPEHGQNEHELTVTQAAALAGCDGSYIRRLLIQRRLVGRKLADWMWLVDRASLVAWMGERKRRA